MEAASTTNYPVFDAELGEANLQLILPSRLLRARALLVLRSFCECPPTAVRSSPGQEAAGK